MASKKLKSGILASINEWLTTGTSLEDEDARRWRRYQVIKLTGWTLEQYRRNPAWFNDEIYAMLVTEIKAQ